MLLFDVGNSRCKWAWIENGKWLHQGAFNNRDNASWLKLKASFASFGVPQKILVSNVAGAAMEKNLQELCAIWPTPLEKIVAQAEQCGVYNAYEQAAQLGMPCGELRHGDYGGCAVGKRGVSGWFDTAGHGINAAQPAAKHGTARRGKRRAAQFSAQHGGCDCERSHTGNYGRNPLPV